MQLFSTILQFFSTILQFFSTNHIFFLHPCNFFSKNHNIFLQTKFFLQLTTFFYNLATIFYKPPLLYKSQQFSVILFKWFSSNSERKRRISQPSFDYQLSDLKSHVIALSIQWKICYCILGGVGVERQGVVAWDLVAMRDNPQGKNIGVKSAIIIRNNDNNNNNNTKDNHTSKIIERAIMIIIKMAIIIVIIIVIIKIIKVILKIKYNFSLKFLQYV